MNESIKNYSSEINNFRKMIAKYHHDKHKNQTRRREMWGNSRAADESEASRMVYVRNIPYQVPIAEYRKFFEQFGRVVGIYVDDHRAIIKYDRPLARENALSNNQKVFKEKTLYMSSYTFDSSKDTKGRHVSMYTNGSLAGRRSRNISRSRSRSASRERLSPRRKRNSWMSPKESSPDNNDDRSEEPTWISDFADIKKPNLPEQIELILKMMLAENTARTLSYSQLQSLINFCEHEKRYVWGAIIPPRSPEVPSQNPERHDPEPEPVENPEENINQAFQPKEEEVASNLIGDTTDLASMVNLFSEIAKPR